MKKRLLALVVALSCSAMPVWASDNNEGLNINDVVASTHEEVKDLPANLSPAQMAKLQSLGVPVSELENITIGEVAEILKTHTETVDISPMLEYIDSEALQAEAEMAIEERQAIFDELGLTEEEQAEFMLKKPPFVNYEELTKEFVLAQLSNPHPVHPYDDNCHIFTGKRALDLLLETKDCHFAPSSFPLYMQDPDTGVNLYVGKNPNPRDNPREYELKVNLLEDHLNDTRAAYQVLYNDYGKIDAKRYAIYPYGEEYNNEKRQFHEGVDFNSGWAANVYAITNGVISCIVKGDTSSSSPSGASSLMVYNPTYKVTVIYSHLKIDGSFIVGDTIQQGTLIGTQSNIGTDQQHTHVQIQSGRVTEAKQIHKQDETLSSLKPYAYFWIWTK